jgi:type IV pilus assembly protein PilB
MSVRIAEILKRSGLLSKDNLVRALEFSQRDGVPLAHFVLSSGMADEKQFMEVISAGLGIQEIVWPHELDIENAVINCMPRDMAYSHRMIPINRLANNLIVAVGDPSNIGLFDAISSKLGVKLKVKLASELSIQKALDKYYANKLDESRKTTNLEGAETYVMTYVEKLMQNAVARKASDIHIEPYETAIRVRLRVDGSLVEYDPRPRYEAKDALISRVKIISGLDISEKRYPQDGNAKLEVAGYGKMDFRVSSMPTVWGEKIVLRILDKGNLQLDMKKLGFDQEQLDKFQEAIFRPFGMVVVTGPTGSGKTTTLYSALNELNRVSDCVVTAEDPVEFTIAGINQVMVRPDIDFTFSKALKAFLRQDPDVIMVGEIRDPDTAEIAMKAALTGHIVLSTLHTNNAPETIERLRNMGVQPFTIISALNAVVAQRLIRKICLKCKAETNIPVDDQVQMGLPAKFAGTFPIFKGQGCEACNGTGYKGRAAIYEVMTLNDAIKRAIAENASVLDLKKIAMKSGMQTLRQSAWKKVHKGITTIDELLESSGSDTDSINTQRSA